MLRIINLAVLAVAVARGQSAERAVSLLSQKCLACHNEKKASSGLSVETRASMLTGGARGPAVVPGRPQESLVVAALRQTGSLKMPLGGKLSDAEISIIEKWIAAGAPGPEEMARTLASKHWAFQTPQRPPEPLVRQSGIRSTGLFWRGWRRSDCCRPRRPTGLLCCGACIWI